MADEAADSHALLSDGAGDKDAEAWSAPDAAPPTKVSDETKTSELSTAMETQIRVAAAQSARDELAKIMGDHVKYLYNEGERSRLLRRAYFAVTVEVQLSGFVKHLFTSAWVEILMMVLAILFYLGDSTTSVAHFVFIFVLHILRAPAVLWVLDRVPRFNAAAIAFGDASHALEQERDRSLQKLKALRTPIVALGVFTLVCAFLDLLAVLIRLWAFKDIEMNEIAPSVLLLLLGLAFCSIDLSAVMWYFSLKYNLPAETVNRLASSAIHHTRYVGQRVVRMSESVVGGRQYNGGELGDSLAPAPPSSV